MKKRGVVLLRSIMAWIMVCSMVLAMAFVSLSNMIWAEAEGVEEMSLCDLDWIAAETTPAGWGTLHKNADINGNPAVVNGVTYPKAIGTHTTADGQWQNTVFDISGLDFSYFETLVGVSSPFANKVEFSILVDGVEKIRYVAKGSAPAKKLAVSVKNAAKLTLRVNCSDDNWNDDSSIWANPTLKKSFPEQVYLSDYEWQSATAPGWGTLNRDASMDGSPAKIGQIPYAHAIGTHAINDIQANQDIVYDIRDMGYVWFSADVGSPDQGQPNRVKFSVLVDGTEAASCITIGGQEAQKLTAWVKGASTITLRVNCDIDGHGFDSSIWGNPMLEKTYPPKLSLSDIPWTDETVPAGYGTLSRDATVEGQVPKVGGTEYHKAIGTHAINDVNQNQDIVFDLQGMDYSWLHVKAGIQDQNFDFINQVKATVLLDGVEISKRILSGNQPAKDFYIRLDGAKKLTLRVNCLNDGHAFDNVIWAEPFLTKTAPEVEAVSAPDSVSLTELNWAYAEAGWGEPSVNLNCEGKPLVIKNSSYAKGLGTHAFAETRPADLIYDIAGMGYQYFTVDAGVDALGPGTVRFEVLGDGSVLAASPVLSSMDEPYPFKVKVNDVRELTLRVYNGDGDYHSDRADWGDPMLYQEASMMPVSLQVFACPEGKTVFDDQLNLNGSVSGADEIGVSLDGQRKITLPIQDFLWEAGLPLDTDGRHTVKVEALKEGEVMASKAFSVKKVTFRAEETVVLQTASTELTLARMDGMLAVQSLKDRKDGHTWTAFQTEVPFPDRIGVDGQERNVVWTYEGKTDQTTKDDVRIVEFRFVCAEEDLTLSSIWTAYPNASAPIRHSMNLFNHGEKEIEVYSVPTLQLDMKGAANESLELMAISKGAHGPDAVGTYFYSVAGGTSQNVFTNSEWRDPDNKLGYIPFSGVQGKNHGVYTGLEWPQGHILTEGGKLDEQAQHFSISNGLNSDFHTVIPSEMNYLVPAAFVGCYTGSRDDGANAMTKWYYDYMMPKTVQDEKYPTLQYSYWWSTGRTRLEWVSTDKNFFKGVDQLSELGFKAGVLDIGWNPADGVFTADPVRWKDGLSKHADYSHAHGMEFGVYFRPFNGMSNLPGSLSSLPGVGKEAWFASDGGGATLDLGNDEAKKTYLNGLRKLIGDSGLDVLRTDFGGIIGKSDRVNRHRNETDVTYWTARGFYEVIGTLQQEFPHLKWENCDTGGTLKDFKSMQFASRIQSTDHFTELSQRRTFYDACYVLPAQQIMQWYSDLIYADRVTDHYDYLFRSNLLGWSAFLIELPEDMMADEKACFARTAEIYNEWMQPLVKHANLYHILPRPDGVNWDGMQYINPENGKGAVLVFKGTTEQNQKTVYLKGLDVEKQYHIWSEDRTVDYQICTGAELMNQGVTFTLEGPYRSEILYLQEVGKADEAIKAPAAFAAKGKAQQTVDAKQAVTVEWEQADRAETYLATLYCDGQKVAEKRTEKTAVTFKGLKAAKTYSWQVTAENAFGRTAMTGTPSVKATGLEALSFLSEAKPAEMTAGQAEANGVLYLDALTLAAADRVLDSIEGKTVVWELDAAKDYQSLAGTLAMAHAGEGSQLEVTLFTDLGTKAVYLLNEQDPDREISLNLAGAASLTMQVKNTSLDRISQTDRLLHSYADNRNSGKNYARLLHKEAGEQYLFAVDVRHDLMGVIDATPRYGIFGGYVDDEHYIGAYLDEQYNLFTTMGCENGNSLGAYHIPLPADFDHSQYHNLAVYRNGSTFKFYLDGALMDVREANIGASKPGLSVNDTLASYQNMQIEGGSFSAEAPVGGKWSGNAPELVLCAGLYGSTWTADEAEPEAVQQNSMPSIDKDAVLDRGEQQGSKNCIEFEASDDGQAFAFYSSDKNQDVWSIQNGKLAASGSGEQKAIYKDAHDLSEGTAQVEVSLAKEGIRLDGGLYIMAKNAGHDQDAIRALNINLESEPNSRDLHVNIHRFDQSWGGCISTVTLTNYFADGAKKAPVVLKASFADGVLNVYVDNELQIPMMNLPLDGFTWGSVGLRCQHTQLYFDHFCLSEQAKFDPNLPNPNYPEGWNVMTFPFDEENEAESFDFYHSTPGGLAIEEGRLKPVGEPGEFKAILKGKNRTIKELSVDLYPNASGEINGGLYLGAFDADDPQDQIHALAVMVESNFEGWEDAANRVDLVIGTFPEWKELDRLISETGNQNNLFTNGLKEPLRLHVKIEGKTLTVTLSRLDDPETFVQKVYAYGGDLDLEVGQVGLRSMISKAEFDNFQVVYLEQEAPSKPETSDPETSNPDSGVAGVGAAAMIGAGAAAAILMGGKRRKKKEERENQ